MNDKQILELVAKTPKISATELAGALNAELRDVSNALRSLVDVGDLVKSIRFGEQGRQCQVYELSDEFRKSRAGKELLTGLANEADPAGPGTTAPAETVEEVVLSPAAAAKWAEDLAPAKPLPAAAPPARHGPSATKVDRALAHLAKGPSTGVELAKVIGIDRPSDLNGYLAGPRKRNQIVRDGDLWKLASALAPSNVEVVGNVIIATRDQAPVPPEVKAAVAEMASAAVTELRKPEPAPAAAAPPKAYRCAIWTDGTIEICKRKDGQHIELSQAELDEICLFVGMRRVA